MLTLMEVIWQKYCFLSQITNSMILLIFLTKWVVKTILQVTEQSNQTDFPIDENITLQGNISVN